MKFSSHFRQGTALIPVHLHSWKSLSSRLSSLVLFAGIFAVALAAPASLAGQQTTDDSFSPAAVDTSAASTSAPDPESQAQTPAASSSNTNAPAAQDQSQQDAAQDSSYKQTKRILGIVPNFRAISADEKLPPETVKEKFMDATQDSFDYSSIFIPAVLAGYNMYTDNTPEFHQGAAGYARYFWHAAVDQTSENYFVEFIVPTVTREDSRYYTLGHGGFVKRTVYALSRSVITRTNSGSETFNISEVVGAGMASGLSTTYYPARDRSLSNVGSQWGIDVGIDAASFWVKEFWPDINHMIFHNKYSDTPAHQ